MKIKFEEGRDNGYLEYFAISNDEVYRGKLAEELLWAEIRVFEMVEGEPHYRVTWEDSWSSHTWTKTLAEAKEYVVKNYQSHTPHVNGRTYEIKR